jgi:hypothetical protein
VLTSLVLLASLCAGLLQPVNAASMGIMSSSSSLLIATGGGCSGHGLALSSSPCSSTSSQHDRPPSWANGSSRSTPVHHTSARHQQQQPSPSPPPSQQQQQLWGELRMPLVLGQPPADTAVFAPLMAGLQELQVRALQGCVCAALWHQQLHTSATHACRHAPRVSP